MSNSPNDTRRRSEESARPENGRGDPDDESVRNSAPEAGKTNRGARSPDPETDRRDGTDGPLGDNSGRGSDGSSTPGDPGPRKWLGALVAIVGLWIAASPFVYGTTNIARWNNLAVGGALLVLGAYNFARTYRGRAAHVGIAGVAALLGLWSIVAPFALGFDRQGLFWSTVVSGIVVLGLAAYDAYESRRTAAATRSGTRV